MVARAVHVRARAGFPGGRSCVRQVAAEPQANHATHYLLLVLHKAQLGDHGNSASFGTVLEQHACHAAMLPSTSSYANPPQASKVEEFFQLLLLLSSARRALFLAKLPAGNS